MKDGMAQEAGEQYEELRDAQRKVRKGKFEQIVDSTTKSQQREKYRFKRITDLRDVDFEFWD